jgi:hypothetical protein
VLHRKALIYSKESVVSESEYSRKENWFVRSVGLCDIIRCTVRADLL